MHDLSIDLETWSSVSIRDCGAWKYIASPDFEVLLFAYSVDGADPIVIDVAQGEVVPEWLIAALHDKSYTKHAYNAAFEFGALSKLYGQMDPSQWRDTMMHGQYAGYTAGLDATGKAIGLPQDKQKLKTGKDLIRYFCVPCKPTKSNDGRTRNRPADAPEKWELFKIYNRQDVITEMEIERRLAFAPVPDWVQKQWETDLIINQRGVRADIELATSAIAVSNEITAELMDEAHTLTGLANPNSPTQLKTWFTAHGVPMESINKEAITEILTNRDKHDPDVYRVAEIRSMLGKSSVKKYTAIENCMGYDGRIRGLLLFYGANRTGRWAGRLVQVQNLPHSHIEPEGLARDLVKARKINALRLIYGNVPDALSALIRTALIPSEGHIFIDADFSAIEARVISWLACESWRLDVFRTHGKIYEASASQMFGVPIEKIVKGQPEYELRARGKVAELALGYQGGLGAMRRMDTGHKLDGLSDDEVQDIVYKWRDRCPRIVGLWATLQKAAVDVIQFGGTITIPLTSYDPNRQDSPYYSSGSRLTIRREYDNNTDSTALTIELPSGRKLYYQSPSIGANEWGAPSIEYMGVDQQTGTWVKLETYGGKLTENVVQAVARDCLAQAIDKLEAAGFPVVFHIHDEVVIDVAPRDDPEKMLAQVVEIMTQPIPWAEGLPLGADGWTGSYFKKD